VNKNLSPIPGNDQLNIKPEGFQIDKKVQCFQNQKEFLKFKKTGMMCIHFLK
jgi:type II restriction/modification system DNA methylase subunit YeeA